MPFTLNGTGTTLYGARDFRPDGSFVTTEWISVFYVALLPLKSMRILPSGKALAWSLGRCRYQVLQRLPLHGPQIAAVYVWFAGAVASLWSSMYFHSAWLLLPLAVAFGVPWALRRDALRQMREREQRQQMGMTAAPIR